MQTSSLTLANYSTADLAASLVDRILTTQRDHRLATGEKFSYDAALAKMAELDDEPTLDPAVSAKIRTYLAGLYTPRAINQVLAVVAANGTTECGLEFLSPDDRAAVEDLLPEAPEAAWKGPRRKGLLWGGMVARDGVWAH